MKMIFKLLLITTLFTYCSSSNKNKEADINNNWPTKINSLPIKIKVIHTPSVVYATINTKDPEKRGKYQLKHTTTVISLEKDLEIVEFGAYIWENNEWILKTIYDRPFNKEEFIKWYNCENGLLLKGNEYSDTDNWMGKTNRLSGKEMNGLWYFIGKNKEGKLFVGASEIKGIFKMK